MKLNKGLTLMILVTIVGLLSLLGIMQLCSSSKEELVSIQLIDVQISAYQVAQKGNLRMAISKVNDARTMNGNLVAFNCHPSELERHFGFYLPPMPSVDRRIPPGYDVVKKADFSMLVMTDKGSITLNSYDLLTKDLHQRLLNAYVAGVKVRAYTVGGKLNYIP